MLIDQAIHVMRAGGRVRRAGWPPSRVSLEWRNGPVLVGERNSLPVLLLGSDWTASDWEEVADEQHR